MASNNFAAKLAPPQPPSYVANYDTNVKQSIFAGTPIPATMNDLRIVAGQVQSLANKVNSLTPAAPVAQQQFYIDKQSNMCMNLGNNKTQPGQTYYGDMNLCQSFLDRR